MISAKRHTKSPGSRPGSGPARRAAAAVIRYPDSGKSPKISINGTYHAFDFRKYAYRYLSETQYRFNRRSNIEVILTRLIPAAATTGNRPAVWPRLAEAKHYSDS